MLEVDPSEPPLRYARVLVEFAPKVKFSVIEVVVELEEVIVGGDGGVKADVTTLEPGSSVEVTLYAFVAVAKALK